MHHFRAMNTTMHTSGLSQSEQVEVEEWFAFVEKKLSRFLAHSELSQLNRAHGKPFFMSALLNEVIHVALHYYKETHGIFHPFLGNVLAGLGYRDTFNQLNANDMQSIFSPERVQPNFNYDPRMRCLSLQSAVEIDLGGIAKAWSAAYMSQLLKKCCITRGAIDAGGDIVLWGDQSEPSFEVSIANPLQPAHDLLFVQSNHGFAIATSSSEKRKWLNENGLHMHHLIDSRTNLPAQSNLIQVSVLAPDLTTAEVYAKCVLILGEERGVPWLEKQRPECTVIAVRQDLSLVYGGQVTQFQFKGA